MKNTAPHYLLLTQAKSNPDPMCSGGVWQFVLEQIGSTDRVEIAEEEPGCWGERLQLLAVVRGLEALEQPSRVTLITPSRFVGNGIRRGLEEWRNNDWQWQTTDQKAPIQDLDLWKRIDQALQFHQVNCRIWDFDEPNYRPVRPKSRHRISFGEIQNARRLTFAETTNDSQEPSLQQSELNSTNGTWTSSDRRIDLLGSSSATETVGSGISSGSALAIQVKPIGTGRAFGYVPN